MAERARTERVNQKGTGRVTPKGTSSKGKVPPPSGRYTPPIPKEEKVSPHWVPILMFTLLGLGGLMIVLNYLGVLPTGSDAESHSGYLAGGLGLITAGFIVATRYH